MTGQQTNTANAQQSYTFASHTSQPADQSFVKELAKPTQEKLFLKNSRPFKKNKKRNAQPDTKRHKSKQTMTLKPNTDNGLQGQTTERQHTTARVSLCAKHKQ